MSTPNDDVLRYVRTTNDTTKEKQRFCFHMVVFKVNFCFYRNAFSSRRCEVSVCVAAYVCIEMANGIQTTPSEHKHTKTLAKTLNMRSSSLADLQCIRTNDGLQNHSLCAQFASLCFVHFAPIRC